MISGTSKIWSKSWPVTLLTITKILQKIQENMGSSLKTIVVSYLNFMELPNNLKFGPTKHLLFFWFFVGPPPPKKIGISERFQSFCWRRVESWYFRTIIFLKIFKHKHILMKTNISQRVTYHLSKNWSPRGLLVFMENHLFETFSPRTFLVFMENPLFEV